MEGSVLESENPKCQDLSKFQFGGGGVLKKVRFGLRKENLSFEFWGGGVLESQNPKCQDLPKFQFSGWGGGVLESQTQSAKICLNFNFQGWGGGVLEKVRFGLRKEN